MKGFSWPKRRTLVIIFVIFSLLFFIRILYNCSWSGFKEGKDKILTVTETIIEKSQKGVKTTTKTTDTVRLEPAKTLWDWMGLFLAPATLASLGFWFQYSQEKAKRSREESENKEFEKKADQDRERIIDQQHESALQDYFKILSDFLVDKRLKQILLISSGNYINTKNYNEIDSVIDADAALYVIKARTLSLLRLFDRDNPRQANVLSFLGDLDLLTKLNLDLSRSNLENANFSRADLSGVKLNDANLSNADLRDANLSNADLSGANLSNADLYYAILSDASLVDASLIGSKLNQANLSSAQINGAKLNDCQLVEANLLDADFSGSDLSDANLRGANLSKADLRGANLNNADLRRAIGIPDNISNAAINWQTATYSPEVKKRLGLDTEIR
jgi:uncharacterized protein YjbI with pentapeptide repeats